jgi:hypothetical protein
MDDFEPVLTYANDGGVLQFVAEDIPNDMHEVVPGFAIVMAVEEERRPIGFRLFIAPEALRDITAPNDGTWVQLPMSLEHAQAMSLVVSSYFKHHQLPSRSSTEAHTDDT